MSRYRLKWHVWILVLGSLCSMAVASTADSIDPHGDQGQSKDIFAGDIFSSLFAIVLFVVLLLILRKWAWKPILTGLKKREDHIAESIAIAKSNKEEAEKLLNEYQKQMASARQESQTIIDQGRREALKITEQLKQQASEEARLLRDQARRDIIHARDRALEKIYNQAVDLSTDLAGRILEKEIKPEDHRQLIHDALGDLQKNNS